MLCIFLPRWGILTNNRNGKRSVHREEVTCSVFLTCFLISQWTIQFCPKPYLSVFIFPSPIVIDNYNHDPGFSIPSCRTQNLPHWEGSCISEVGSPSAIRCSGTCRVILTTSGQLTWEEHTRPITQLLMLINIRVVLFTGLRGEPTESKTSKICGGKHLLVRSQLSLLLPNPANRGGSWQTLATDVCSRMTSVTFSLMEHYGMGQNQRGLGLLVALRVNNGQWCASHLQSPWARFTREMIKEGVLPLSALGWAPTSCPRVAGPCLNSLHFPQLSQRALFQISSFTSQ